MNSKPTVEVIDAIMGTGRMNTLANKLYSDIHSLRKRGNKKAGVPEGSSQEMEHKINRFFNQRKKRSYIKWEELLEDVYHENTSF